ncbi:MAG: hypothetical protein M1429_02065 [Patescibacteria group bacterium]|nr:hypothetical protein [Patescibacteria group bacterium]
MNGHTAKISKFFNRGIKISRECKEIIASICCLLGFFGFMRGLAMFQIYIPPHQAPIEPKWFLDNLDPTGMIGFVVGIPIFICSAIICIEYYADDKYEEGLTRRNKKC